MTTFPAFEAALAANDQQNLRLLYEVAMHQRDRAEDIVRCLLVTERKEEVPSMQPIAQTQTKTTITPKPTKPTVSSEAEW
jgi:hypothetical protein